MVTELLEPLETLTISEATWNDFDAIMRVLSIVDHEFVPPLTEDENLRVKVSRILNDRRRSWIKAVDDGRIVGVVAVIYHYRRPQLGLIETLAVLPEFRRLGIGKKLVEYAMSKLFQNGMEATLITTWETNVAASTMYHELGFKMILRKKVDGAYFKLFFTRSFEERAPSRSGFSRFWSRR
jgi:ribosomal protein S18 acetylase RimI-like enzyme